MTHWNYLSQFIFLLGGCLFIQKLLLHHMYPQKEYRRYPAIRNQANIYLVAINSNQNIKGIVDTLVLTQMINTTSIYWAFNMHLTKHLIT